MKKGGKEREAHPFMPAIAFSWQVFLEGGESVVRSKMCHRDESAHNPCTVCAKESREEIRAKAKDAAATLAKVECFEALEGEGHRLQEALVARGEPSPQSTAEPSLQRLAPGHARRKTHC